MALVQVDATGDLPPAASQRVRITEAVVPPFESRLQHAAPSQAGVGAHRPDLRAARATRLPAVPKRRCQATPLALREWHRAQNSSLAKAKRLADGRAPARRTH